MRSALATVSVLCAFVALAVAQTCPSTGIACWPDCSTQFKQCSGSTFYPVQDCAAGTKCDKGYIVAAAAVCSGGTPAPTNAPTTTKATQGPTTQAPVTTKAPVTTTTTKAPVTTTTTKSPVTTTTSPGGCKLSDILSQALFDTLFPNANGASKRGDPNQFAPFTYSALVQAAGAYPAFACTGDLVTRKRELAAFLAQTSHETSAWWAGQPYIWGYFFSSELCGPSCGYCGGGSYPCSPGQTYYGRGPIQLSWNYNYGAASQAIYGSSSVLLNNPDSVAKDGVVAFKTALWFWMTPQSPKPSCHDVITGLWSPSASDNQAGRLPGFGMCTNIINGGLECSVSTTAQVLSRVGYFNTYAAAFGISVGANVYCDKMQHY